MSNSEPSTVPETIIIYHGGCNDGFGAAWAAYQKFNGSAEYFEAFFQPGGENDMPDVTGRDVFIIDFSYPRDILAKMREDARSLVLLDHHKTAMEALGDLPYCTFDMDRSGAAMAWDHFHPDKPRPWVIEYIMDRDLWRNELEDTVEINSYLQSLPKSFVAWTMAQDEGRAVALERGRWLYKAKMGYVATVAKLAYHTTVLGHEDVPVVNAPFWNISELLNKLAEDAEFAVGWWQREDGLYQYSLRSKGEFDVSALAKENGGGGHKNAAGFVADTMVHG